ncbi:Pyridoxal-phosphate-dependent serine hydroxymethyltransferase [Gossypium australe]|uniref:Pyridoxal-phosphate-dependent serine hydroxymethyltransferase n=1 Tax=Gossypium australe TaxID=47621 RepID=A0A5B6WIB9_9ROSI|nr:Pyridoxal-phosphate-dependent serine hydroxymethyltransferase [Gossypium australe]
MIMKDLDYDPEERLKGTLPLLIDETYYWRQSIAAFQKKYVDTRYMEANIFEFIELKQRGRTMEEYEAELLRLNRYTKGIVATGQEKIVRFKNQLRFDLKIQVAPQQKWGANRAEAEQFGLVYTVRGREHKDIQGEVFLADFMELPFREFNLILGLDWLVILKTVEGSLIVMVGERQNYLSNMTFTMVIEKLV